MQSQVADPLIAGHGLQLEVLVDIVGVRGDMGRNRNDILVGGVGHPVQQILPLLNAVKTFGVVFIQLLDSRVVVVQRHIGHMTDQVGGLVQGDGGVGDQVHVQLPEIFFDIGILLILGLSRDKFFGQSGKQTAEGQQQNGRDYTEQTVDIGDAAGVKGPGPKVVTDHSGHPHDADGGKNQKSSQHIVDYVDQAGADLLCLGAKTAYQIGGDAVTDIDAHDDREHTAEGHADGTGNGLQDTDNSRGALDHARDSHAGQKAEKIVVFKGGQQPAQTVAQGADCAAHVHQTDKENAEPHQDGADIGCAVFFLSDKHDQDHPDHQGKGSQIVGFEEIQQAGLPGIHIHQPDDLGGDGGTHVGTQNDPDGLPEGQKPGTDQTDRQNDGGGGALDHAGDQNTQYKTHDRFVGDLG